MSEIYPLNTFRTKSSIFIMFASNIKDNLEDLIGEAKTIEFTCIFTYHALVSFPITSVSQQELLFVRDIWTILNFYG